MPQQGWNDKRERQYEHIKEGVLDRGEDEDTAKEIAARTVNKQRARAGEARSASCTSTEDISSGRRGGLRSRQLLTCHFDSPNASVGAWGGFSGERRSFRQLNV